ncbi:MAG: MFS transporter, partial [Rhodobacterales bacterium CG_4_10_14_0_8_um_filter_70_9]
GALFGFIGSAQQILAELYGLGAWFPIAFAGVAVAIALASLVNALMVERLGMRALSHGAVIAFTAISATLAALSLAGPPPLWLFMALLGAAMMLVGLTFANFNALAMAPMAEAAGIASSLIGGATTVIGASLGFVIARAYDGTITPLAVGYTLCGAGCLGLLLVTERGRLMRGGV